MKKTLNEILAENNGVFPFLAAREGEKWTLVYDRVRFSNENDEDAVPEEAKPVKNGYFYGVKTDEIEGALLSPDSSVWERWETIRRSGQIRDVFDEHQTTCERCGLGNVPKRCRGAEIIRTVYMKAEGREAR